MTELKMTDHTMKLDSLRTSLAPIALAILGAVGSFGAMTARAADPGQVLIKDFMFTPMTVTVKAGATVNWVNMDDEPHTVVSDTGLFRSNGLDTNETFSYKFDKPGTYRIVCSIHPRMVATVVVE